MNITDSRDRWVRAGAPAASSLAVDGVIHFVRHPTHAARILGLPLEARLVPTTLAWDLLRILDGWLECLRITEWPLLLEPTPSRQRSARRLAVNVFMFADPLPAAWTTGIWKGDSWEEEEERAMEETLTDQTSLLEYVSSIQLELTAFVQRVEVELPAAPSRMTRTAGGDLSYADLLDGQRIHSAHHFRQVMTFLESRGARLPTFSLDEIPDLNLPSKIY